MPAEEAKGVVSLRVEYVEEMQQLPSEVSLRRGAAGLAWLGPSGQLESETRVDLMPNSAHALIGHGVVDELNELPLQGRLGSGLQVLIPPAMLDQVLRILYAADTKTYGAVYEFVVASLTSVEYRIQIDNREYQRTLSRLQFLVSAGSREGRSAWLSI